MVITAFNFLIRGILRIYINSEFLILECSFLYYIIIFLREKVIDKIINNVSHVSIYILNTIINIISYILHIIVFLTFTIMVMMGKEWSNANTTYILLVLSIFFLYHPIYLLYSNILTYKGYIYIEFEQLFLKIHNYYERQKWMIKIFKKLESSLKISYMDIPHSTFIRYINNKLANSRYTLNGSESIKKYLKELKNWMVDDNQSDSILILVRKIIPKEEIKTYKKIPKIFLIITNLKEYWSIIQFIVPIIIGYIISTKI